MTAGSSIIGRPSREISRQNSSAECNIWRWVRAQLAPCSISRLAAITFRSDDRGVLDHRPTIARDLAAELFRRMQHMALGSGPARAMLHLETCRHHLPIG